MRDWLDLYLPGWFFFALLAALMALGLGFFYLVGGTEQPQGRAELIEGEILSLSPDPYHADLQTSWTATVRLRDGRTGIVTLPSGAADCIVGSRIKLRAYENGHLRATLNCRQRSNAS
jgi:hypothetical protein